MKAVRELLIQAVSKAYATSLQHLALQEPSQLLYYVFCALYPKFITMCYTFQLAVGNVELCM